MPALREGDAVSGAWEDPAYVVARKARAVAYAEFCRVAGANPHRRGTQEFQAYYEREVMPVRAVFIEAADVFIAESGRVAKEGKA